MLPFAKGNFAFSRSLLVLAVIRLPLVPPSIRKKDALSVLYHEDLFSVIFCWCSMYAQFANKRYDTFSCWFANQVYHAILSCRKHIANTLMLEFALLLQQRIHFGLTASCNGVLDKRLICACDVPFTLDPYLRARCSFPHSARPSHTCPFRD